MADALLGEHVEPNQDVPPPPQRNQAYHRHEQAPAHRQSAYQANGHGPEPMRHRDAEPAPLRSSFRREADPQGYGEQSASTRGSMRRDSAMSLASSRPAGSILRREPATVAADAAPAEVESQSLRSLRDRLMQRQR